MAEDRHLLRRLRCGDQSALRRIYEDYKADLLMIATCILLDGGVAEDCLQDVFVTLAGKAPRLHIKSSLRAYLVTAVANRARDRWHSKRRQPVSITELTHLVSHSSAPQQHMVDCEESDRLFQGLCTLPAEQREVITLRLHGDLTFKAIARLQGVSTNTAQGRYRYGFNKLRDLLSE